MEGLELLCFQIISNVGSARSEFIEAIQEAKKGKFKSAYEKMHEGDKQFILGHKKHSELIQKEASGQVVETNLLLIHAEDQLMSAEHCQRLAMEFIAMYERLTNIETSLR